MRRLAGFFCFDSFWPKKKGAAMPKRRRVAKKADLTPEQRDYLSSKGSNLNLADDESVSLFLEKINELGSPHTSLTQSGVFRLIQKTRRARNKRGRKSASRTVRVAACQRQ